VQKSADDPNQAGKWEVPGGRMDFGEDVDEHIRREVLEEVGVEIRPGPPFYVWQWRIQRPAADGETRDIQVVAVARLCEALSGSADTGGQKEDDYLAGTRWVALDQIDRYDWIGNMAPVLREFQAVMSRTCAHGEPSSS
jgi:8-oxo-dGTP pyrophosphatase MutT (NUDIX family)